MQIIEIRKLIKEVVLHTNSGRWQYGRKPCCTTHRCISKKRHMLNRLHGPKIGKNTEKAAKIFQNAKKPIKRDVSKDKRVIFTKITCKPIFTRNRSQMYSFWRLDVIFCCHGTLKTEYPAAERDTILP